MGFYLFKDQIFIYPVKVTEKVSRGRIWIPKFVYWVCIILIEKCYSKYLLKSFQELASQDI